jgi:hypothetical protein
MLPHILRHPRSGKKKVKRQEVKRNGEEEMKEEEEHRTDEQMRWSEMT